MEILTPREVPLGGLRAMTVRRTLPQRQRTLIGAWCFVDHYGPDQVDARGGMVVPPHPHTGLQTVSWLFSGEIEHRDSAGHQALVRPGEVNLMTAGRGISHSRVLHARHRPCCTAPSSGWRCPTAHRHVEPDFEHFAPEPVAGDGWEARVFLGSLLGATSPVRTYTPAARRRAAAPGRDDARRSRSTRRFEHGLLLDSGALTVDGEPLAGHDLGYLEPGREEIELVAPRGRPAAAARRPAVRREDRDVVELHRPRPRRGRRVPRASGRR